MICPASFTTLTDIIYILVCLLRYAVPIAAAAALLFFFWGMSQFMLAAGDTEKRKTAQSRIVWGLVGITVIMSVAALVAILQNTFFGSSYGSSYNGSSGIINHYNSTITLPQNQNSGGAFFGGGQDEPGGPNPPP